MTTGPRQVWMGILMPSSSSLESRDVPPMGVIPPPPGQTANFVNPPQSAEDAVILVAVGVAISGLFMVLRLYTKGFLLRRFGLEDVSILIAWICSTATCLLEIEGRKFGTGRHLWDVPISEFSPRWGKVVTAAVVMYCPAMMFAKLALLLFYLRLAPQAKFRLVVWTVMAITISYNLSLMLALIFACKPIAATWDASITEKTCIDTPAVYLANAILNIATDFIILLLPVRLVWNIQMKTRQKMGVMSFFTVGSAACIVSIIRLKTLIPTLSNPDQTWAIASPGNWIIIEVNLAIVCGCLSVIKPFLRHHLPVLIGDSHSSMVEYNRSANNGYFQGSRSDKVLVNSSGDGSSTWPPRQSQSDTSPPGGASKVGRSGSTSMHQSYVPPQPKATFLRGKDDDDDENSDDLEMAILPHERYGAQGHNSVVITTDEWRKSTDELVPPSTPHRARDGGRPMPPTLSTTPSSNLQQASQGNAILRTTEFHVHQG